LGTRATATVFVALPCDALRRRTLPLKVPLDGVLVELFGLTFDDRNCPPRTVAQARPQSVALDVGDQPCLSVDDS
jgi:hypothetical protein